MNRLRVMAFPSVFLVLAIAGCATTTSTPTPTGSMTPSAAATSTAAAATPTEAPPTVAAVPDGRHLRAPNPTAKTRRAVPAQRLSPAAGAGVALVLAWMGAGGNRVDRYPDRLRYVRLPGGIWRAERLAP